VDLRTLRLEEQIAEGTNAWELFDIVDLPRASGAGTRRGGAAASQGGRVGARS